MTTAGDPGSEPRLGRDDALSDEIEDRLVTLVLAAQAGDAGARNAVYHLLEPKLRRWVEREWWLIRRRAPLIEMGDIADEAFLVLADLIAGWPGEGGFGAYVMRVFPWRLRAAVRAQAGLPVRQRQGSDRAAWDGPMIAGGGEAATTGPSAGLREEESYLAQEALTLLETLAGSLATEDRLLLIWRVRDGHSMIEIARRLGISRRHAHRRWEDLTIRIRLAWVA